MWQLESDVSESLEEAKERERWSQERLAEIEAREQAMQAESEKRLHDLNELKERYQQALRAEERMESKLSGVEATSVMLQKELEVAREKFDRAENDNRELLKRNTQLEIEIKSKSLLAQRAEEALIKAKDELSLNQTIKNKLEEAHANKIEAEKLLEEARAEADLLSSQKAEFEQQKLNIESQSKEIDELKQSLKSKEQEMQQAVDEALKQAQEERELARIERKAAEADRLAAKADRQVAQRELIASARKNSGSYSVNDIMEALHNESDGKGSTNTSSKDSAADAVSNVQSKPQGMI